MTLRLSEFILRDLKKTVRGVPQGGSRPIRIKTASGLREP